LKKAASTFKLFSDETRLRMMMLLGVQELCVCHLMGVLGVSQPLVSRNLSLMSAAGLLAERRQGKLVFYSLRKDLKSPLREAVDIIKRELKNDAVLRRDLVALKDSHEFQKKTGRYDMKTFLEFMKRKEKRRN
jgi:ArsR family transcriptional regulator